MAEKHSNAPTFVVSFVTHDRTITQLNGWKCSCCIRNCFAFKTENKCRKKEIYSYYILRVQDVRLFWLVDLHFKEGSRLGVSSRNFNCLSSGRVTSDINWLQSKKSGSNCAQFFLRLCVDEWFIKSNWWMSKRAFWRSLRILNFFLGSCRWGGGGGGIIKTMTRSYFIKYNWHYKLTGAEVLARPGEWPMSRQQSDISIFFPLFF